MRSLLALALLAGFATAAPVPKAVKKKDDKAMIAGRWLVTELTVNGRNTNVSYNTFTFDTEGKVTLRSKKDDPSGSAWTWTIDPTVDPPGMQWATQNGKNDWQLVYEVTADTLKVGFIAKGAKPPTKVEPCDGLTLYVMTRDTSK